MFYRVGLPMIFVFLWSSAFVTAKVAVDYATPFTLLLLRYAVVALLFGLMMMIAAAWHRRKMRAETVSSNDSWRTILATALVGVMLHGAYLGSVFLALDLGVPAGLAALIVSTQPLLSSFAAIFLFKEPLRFIQWAGIILGLFGVSVVLLPTIDGSYSLAGLGVTFFGLLAITSGTLMQKKFGNTIGLLKGNFIQVLRINSILDSLSMCHAEVYFVRFHEFGPGSAQFLRAFRSSPYASVFSFSRCLSATRFLL